MIELKSISKKKLIIFIILVLIISASLVLRVYRLDSFPPSISWDEAAVGINSWMIGNYGKDEYGNLFPIYFKSFADDKHPVHVYSTAISTKLLGLSEFSTRFPSALFGVFNVILVYFIGKILFKKELIGITAAAFLAVSPYNIHFSRFNHEANFVIFFYMLGLVLFILSFKKDIALLPLSLISFITAFLTYHNAKVLVPVTMFILFGLYFKEIIQSKIIIIICIFILLGFGIILYRNPSLLGLARVNQTTLNPQSIENTYLYKTTQNQTLGRLNLIAIQYSWHFSSEFLFLKGDKNPRLSAQTGQFYWFDLPFILLGILFLIYKRSKEGLIVLVWFLAAPLPSSLVDKAPHAARASFMMGSWQILSAAGFYFLITLIKKFYLKVGLIIISILILGSSLNNFLKYYFGEYSQRYAIEWQYGMKQIVEYVKDHPEYETVYMTEVRSQPYIFFLYYLKYPMSEFLSKVYYNNSGSKSYNTVSNFDKYFFGNWDKVESFPHKGVLYIVTPSEYSGLRHINEFEVKKNIKYPNGSDAFFIVSVN